MAIPSDSSSGQPYINIIIDIPVAHFFYVVTPKLQPAECCVTYMQYVAVFTRVITIHGTSKKSLYWFNVLMDYIIVLFYVPWGPASNINHSR